MDPGRLLRAVRRARRLSQRELAQLCELRRSTVERIESGATEPHLATMVRLLAPLGFRLVVLDDAGNLLELDDEHDRLRDAALRRFPAHLRARPARGDDGWWDAFQISPPPGAATRREWTFDRRSRWDHGPWWAVYSWDDAT